MLFPAAALGVALVLVLRDRIEAYAAFVLWLFALTPLVRRLVDYRVGWLDANTLMLAPYAACAVALVALPSLVMGRVPVPGRMRLLILLGSVAYAFGLALLGGRLISGVYDALRWALPPAFAALLLLARPDPARLRAYVEVHFAIALTLCSLYGIWQFLTAPPWDAMWMANAGMESIGRPYPFEIRVFSTWNSPGSFSFFLLAAILALACARVPLARIALVLGLAALALSLVRSAWIGLAFGLLVILVLGDLAARARIGIAVLAAAVALPVLALDPRVEDLLSERARSLTSLGGDVSADDRLAAYHDLAAELDDHPFGLGLAIAGGYAEADGGQGRIIDGGFIEVPLAMGVVGGALHLACAVSLGLAGLMAARGRPALAGYAATLACFGLLFTSGTTTVGEIGLFFWLSVALLLLARSGAPPTDGEPSPPPRHDPAPSEAPPTRGGPPPGPGRDPALSNNG